MNKRPEKAEGSLLEFIAATVEEEGYDKAIVSGAGCKIVKGIFEQC